MGNSLLPINEPGLLSGTFGNGSLRFKQPYSLDALHRTALFHGLDRKLLDVYLDAALPRHFLPGQVLCRQGEPATSLHLITAGVVKIYGTTAGGADALFDWFRLGDVIGLESIVSPPCPNVWSAEVIEPTDSLTWDLKCLKALGGPKDMLCRNALAMAIQRATNLQERFQEVATEKVEQRIARLMVYLRRQLIEHNDKSSELKISNEELAQMTGTNPYTVNRILNQWERKGHIEKGRKWVRVISAQAIGEISMQDCGARQAARCD